VARTYSREDAASHIQEFLDPVLHYAGLKLSYTISEGETVHPDFENPDFLVRFEGEDVDLLLGNKAELLLALEQLTSEALGMTPEQHSRLCFDANDHRVLRIEELRMSAQAAAERVRKTRIPFHFSPMSSRERRIIHLALRNETAVRSESVGEGSIRQVVVVPADMKTLPEPIRPPRPPRSDDGFRGRPGREGDRRERPRGPRRDRDRRR
jgi:spoIIIJ-associated protein